MGMGTERKEEKTSTGLPVFLPLQSLGWLSKVIAPTALLTALLFYFGWARSSALYRAFGVDQSLLGFSTLDYLMRSLPVAFEPLRWSLVVVLAAGWLHFVVTRWLKQRPEDTRTLTARRVVWLVVIMGLLALSSGPVTLALGYLDRQSTLRLILPFSWMVGVALIGYSFYLGMHFGSRPTAITPGLYQTSLAVVAALVVFGLFWTVSLWADQVGQWSARDIAAHLDDLPSVVVYSQRPLNIDATGVNVTQISQLENAYQYRYTGLKFLIRSNERYFLLPVGWSEREPVTIVLLDEDHIRLEVSPSGAYVP